MSRRSSCQCQARMQQIPAKYLTEKVKHQLSVILDPVKLLPGADHRTFAELNGLTPDVQMWLDSQRTHPTMTSNIRLILDYLIQTNGDRYTVYNVYNTLCKMNSDGVNVILNGMSGICMLYNRGTREGQEQSEPSSVVSTHQSLPVSPPSLPPGPGTQRSEHLVSDGSVYPFNDLGDANPQIGHSAALPSFQNIPNNGNNFRPPASEISSIHPVAVEYSDNCCTQTLTIQGHPERRSASFDGPLLSMASSCGDPPSYEESQRNHGYTQPLDPTQMHDLKQHLPESPEFEIDFIRPTDSFRTCSLTSTSAYSRHRPESFPQTRQKPISHIKRPFSEGSCPDHQGACGCPSLSFCPVQPDTCTDVSTGIEPWKHPNHQTDVKRPLDCVTDKTIDWSECAPSLVCTSSERAFDCTKDYALPGTTGSTTCSKSDYFVFILAGDNNKQNQALQVQLESLSDALKQDCIPHVIMSSCWKLPIIKLRRHILNQLPKLTSEDPNGADCFLKESLKKASRVLLLISPGTYSYLDKYAKGGKEHSNQLQAKLRLCYETLKDEWFKQDSKYHRILPVMLTNMETDQSHCPSFLIESKLYWFPHRPLDSDYTVIKVLQNLLKKDTRLKKQLNVISQKK